MIKIHTVPGGSIMTNSYIIEENNNILLIDFVPEVEEIIKKNNYKVDKIFLTHVHFDHLEGLSKFQKNHFIDIFVSKEGLECLQYPENDFIMIFPEEVISNYKNLNLNNFNVLANNKIIIWNNHEIKVLKSPGHSADGLMFIIDEIKSVFTGDTIFYGSVGRTDLPGGNFETMIDSINRLFESVDDDYKIYPGHGPATTVLFEKNNNPFLT